MPKESFLWQNNMICQRDFLPYDFTPVLVKKLPIYYKFTKGKSFFENFMYWSLWQIKFLCTSSDSIGIPEMDFEGIFEASIFLS